MVVVQKFLVAVIAEISCQLESIAILQQVALVLLLYQGVDMEALHQQIHRIYFQADSHHQCMLVVVVRLSHQSEMLRK